LDILRLETNSQEGFLLRKKQVLIFKQKLKDENGRNENSSVHPKLKSDLILGHFIDETLT